MRRPWDRRRDESPEAYSLFVSYRDLGPTRSMAKLVAANDSGASQAQMETYSKRYDWPGRAGAWDDHLEDERSLEAVVEAREMTRQHIILAKTALSKAIERLRAIDPDRLTIREAIMLAEFALKTERSARGEPTEVADHRADTTRASGSDILETLRNSPDLLDLARKIDERLEDREADD